MLLPVVALIDITEERYAHSNGRFGKPNLESNLE